MHNIIGVFVFILSITFGAFSWGTTNVFAPEKTVQGAMFIASPSASVIPSFSPDVIPTSEPTFFPTPTPESAPQQIIQNAGGLLGLVNNYRTGKGMESLRENQGLCNYSQSRKEYIMQFSHGPFAQNFQSYCSECSYVGENISQGYSDTDALNAWLGSGAHIVNIEGDWRYGCVSYYPNDILTLTVGK